MTQFQYNGWPTVEGQVPEVTRGLIELADQAQSHQTAQQNSGGTTGPIVVHCMWVLHTANPSNIGLGRCEVSYGLLSFHFYRSGSDRSSMFVALSILIQQLRTEKKIDVSTVSRKLRNQRQGMLQTFVSLSGVLCSLADHLKL